nr:MAG TPA: hypothetical protein [Caudoviricetes sp.]
MSFLLACVSTSIFLLSPANAFYSFHSPGLYVAFPVGWECQPVSPTAGKQRFNSVTQHNDSLLFSWKFSFYNLQSLFPALDEMGFVTFYHFKEQR